MAARTREIRNDHTYRMRLALRDEPDYSNDEIPPETILKEPEWTRKQWYYVKQLQARLLHLESKIMELRTKKKRTFKKYE